MLIETKEITTRRYRSNSKSFMGQAQVILK